MQTLILRPIFDLREVDMLKPTYFARDFFLNHKGRRTLPRSLKS